MLQIVASLTDDSRGVIYNCNIFLYRPLLAQKVKHLKEFLIEHSWPAPSYNNVKMIIKFFNY
jgi:hypothetical protein